MRISILTEEFPQVGIVKYIVEAITNEQDVEVCLTHRKHGTYTVTTNTIHEVELSLFTGTTSSVDYIVLLEGEPVLLIEATKTTDSDSRNSSAYQRLIKFIIAKQYFPDAILVMYYEGAFKAKHTNTLKFGIRLLKTLGAIVVGHTGEEIFQELGAFDDIDSIMDAKNNMKANSANVGIRITKTNTNSYTISAKLVKSNTFSHDPNKGLVSALCYCINQLSHQCCIEVIEHGLSQSMIEGKMGNKFWYAVEGINVTLKSLKLSQRPQRPFEYWKNQSVSSEKTASIACHFAYSKDKWQCIFHNHAGGTRSFLLLGDGTQQAVPKSLKVPDMVFKRNNEILIIESKNLKTLKQGDVQLTALSGFESMLESKFVHCSLQKGLCLAMQTLVNIPSTKHDIVYLCKYD
jgi:hypothetical protein